MSDPVRMLDDGSGASPALRGLLRSAEGDGPTAADLARLAAKLGPLLVATVPASAAAASLASSAGAGGAAVGTAKVGVAAGAAAVGGSALKVAVIASVGGALLVSGAFQAGRSYEAARPERRVEAPRAAAVAPVPEPVLEPEAPLEPPAAEVAPVPARPPKPAAREAPRPAPAPAETEVALLQQALAAMGSGEIEAALALTVRHQQEHPRGLLAQEREMLAIEALVKLGRAADGQARADAFRREFPTSSHLLRLDSLVGRSQAR